MHKVNIGLLGFGTVGQAVATLCHDFDGVHYAITRALVRDITKVRSVSSIPLTQDPYDMIHDPNIHLLVEASGGKEHPREWILDALRNGKAVVTANKEVMAYHGPELLLESIRNKTFLGYEASVGGGIPILEPLSRHLSSAPIDRIYGIVNGTSNYLLTAMSRGASFEAVLHEAQLQGYAEADPTADIEGHDAVRKLVLLIHLGMERWVHPDHIAVSGVKPWSPQLFRRLARAGYVLRQVAIAERIHGDQVAAQVSPMAVPMHSLLGQLQGTTNGIGVFSAAGHYWAQGPGAGGLATATSIWADIRRSQELRSITDDNLDREKVAMAPPVNLPILAIAEDEDRALALRPNDIYPLSSDHSLVLGSHPVEDGVFIFPVLSTESKPAAE